MQHSFAISAPICIRKNISRFLKKKRDWKKKHDCKHLKNFSYQAGKVNKADVTEKEDKDETDQELPPWIKVKKSRFNEIRDVITNANESKLMTKLKKRNITLKNDEVIRRCNQWKD